MIKIIGACNICDKKERANQIKAIVEDIRKKATQKVDTRKLNEKQLVKEIQKIHERVKIIKKEKEELKIFYTNKIKILEQELEQCIQDLHKRKPGKKRKYQESNNNSYTNKK